MSYFENLHAPKIALESLGLRRDEAQVADLVLPMLAAFGIGIGIGAGATLLLAPQSGRDLRDDLRARAGKLGDGVRRSLPNDLRSEDMVDDDGAEPQHDPVSRAVTS